LAADSHSCRQRFHDHPLSKTLERVRWRKAGALDLRLVVIRPVPCQGPGAKSGAGLRRRRVLHAASGAAKEYGWTAKPNVIPLPKWRDPENKYRASTLDLISELRRELWADAIDRTHLTDFMSGRPSHPKSHKCKPNLASCLFAATA